MSDFDDIESKPWVWGADSICATPSNYGVMITQLESPKTTGGMSGSSLPSPVQPVPIQVGTYLTIVDGVVTYVGDTPQPSSTTTTAAPTTTSSSTTSTSSTSSTSTSSTSTSSTTTTTPPGYAHVGTDCQGGSVTIYTDNSAFDSADPAYTDNRLTMSFSGYFTFAGTTYLYTNGISELSNCPTTTSTSTSSTTTSSTSTSSTTTTTVAPTTTTTPPP